MGKNREDVTPAYRRLHPEELKRRARAARDRLKTCTICPRNCGVDRISGETGFCRTGVLPFVSSHGPHFGEEAPLVGGSGSGTIFFGNCNLGCIFCQNYTISHQGDGGEVSHEELALMMIDLQRAGCHNINLVSPTHQVPAILNALCHAKDRGLRRPLVYNCGGYESLETLRLLDGVIDIYMPDIKVTDAEIAGRLLKAEDYPERAREAVREMHRQVGDLIVDTEGVARRGLLVRHLVLPGGLAGSEEVFRFLAEELSTQTYLNVMDQYRPCFRADREPPMDRRPTRAELQAARDAARSCGLHRLDDRERWRVRRFFDPD